MPYLQFYRARRHYTCAECSSAIEAGQLYFRDEPHPWARMRGQRKVRHLCTLCILGEAGKRQLLDDGELSADSQLPLDFTPLQSGVVNIPACTEIVDISPEILKMLADDPQLLFELNPKTFETLVCNRLEAMGYVVHQVGSSTFAKDGGIDILAASKEGIPYLIGVQAKHTTLPTKKIAPPVIRELAGAVGTHGLNAGLLVTNTTFTPDARWFAAQRPFLCQLRDFEDLSNWLKDNFLSELAWRRLPKEIQLYPGVAVKLPR